MAGGVVVAWEIPACVDRGTTCTCDFPITFIANIAVAVATNRAVGRGGGKIKTGCGGGAGVQYARVILNAFAFGTESVARLTLSAHGVGCSCARYGRYAVGDRTAGWTRAIAVKEKGVGGERWHWLCESRFWIQT